jgi:hypothetical protein
MTGERAVADLLIGIGIAARKMEDRCADLAISGKIEVKSDRLALTSGAVAVEVAFRGRASGIMATCATCWAFVVGDCIILVSAASLRAAIAGLADRAAGEGATIRLLPLHTLRSLGVAVAMRGAR